jgi:diguanylate cyclase (GGDEF)-like protein
VGSINPAIPKRIIVGFGVAFAILAVNALVDYRSFVTLTDATDSVQDGLQTRDLLKGIRSAVAASETGQRNYILTENKDHLESSLDLLKSARMSLNELLEAVNRDPQEVDKARQLQSLLAARVAQFEGALEPLTQKKKAAALQVLTSAEGRQILERADEVFAQLNESQGALFERRIRELQQSARFALVTFYIATFCGLVLLGLLYYLVYRDIAERRRAEEKLRVVATHDPLTALPNRTLLHERLSHALAKAQHYDRHLAVLFVDLDRFKNINDTLGHEAGDLLLQMAAQRMGDCLRGTDTMARQGGDEFVVLMDELTDAGPAAGVSQRILDAMGKPFNVDGQDVHLTASIGISVFPEDGRALLKNADIAMYCAKDKGRNNYQFYSTQFDKHSVERLSLEASLHRALDRNEFTLHYQPKVDIATGQISGMEALLRWQHPELGWIQPARFIPLAEESGLIQKIGGWVLKTACAQNRAWQKQGMRPLRVAVNLSSHQFASDSVLQDVEIALQESGLEAPNLELEITESAAMHNPEQTASILRQLKNLGTHISVDDFGTGYSSLAYLKRLPIDSIKVDRSFVEDLPEDLESVAITTAVINMAHVLRLRVVAEGVESAAQLRFLHGEGCDEMQGYLFSEARPAFEIPGLMRKTLRHGVGSVLQPERRRRAS